MPSSLSFEAFTFTPLYNLNFMISLSIPLFLCLPLIKVNVKIRVTQVNTTLAIVLSFIWIVLKYTHPTNSILTMILT